jgi:hypothetical protein
MDNVVPTIDQISRRYEQGYYDHSVESTIGTMLELIDDMREVLIESDRISESALRGWQMEKEAHDKLKSLTNNKESNNG